MGWYRFRAHKPISLSGTAAYVRRERRFRTPVGAAVTVSSAFHGRRVRGDQCTSVFQRRSDALLLRRFVA
jgi:hypothetical protein